MAAPIDRVQLHKQESAAGGGDAADADDFLLSPLEPNEDAAEMQGVFLQPPAPSTTRDDEAYVSRDDSGNMIFKDENNSEKTLTDLAAAAAGLLPLENLLYTNDLCIIVVDSDFVEKP